MSATQPRTMDAMEQRLAFTWRHDEDLPVAEMSRRLGRSASAVTRVGGAAQVDGCHGAALDASLEAR